MSRFIGRRLQVFCFAATCLTAMPSYANPINLITNGTFTSTTMSGDGQIPTNGLTGWVNNDYNGSTSVGYNFLYLPGTADTTAGLQLWGSNNGGLNVLTNSPAGGNMVGMDGAYQQGTLSQTLTGLTIGTEYYVSFYFAGAQQHGFTGITTEQFAVALSASSTALAPTSTCATTGVQCTINLTNQSLGFTGWNFQGFTFTATSATDTLSFLALGTPNGEPPFSLLSGVSLQIPEPGSVFSLLAGLGSLILLRRRKQTRGLALVPAENAAG